MNSGIRRFSYFVPAIAFGTSAACAQTVPGFSTISSPSIVPAISPAEAPVFSPDVGINCPTPSFTVGAYGATAGNNAGYPDSVNARSDLDNYGLVAAISVPIGGRLSRYCIEYAEGLLKRQEADNYNTRINNKSILINNCLAFRGRIDFSDPVFDMPEFEAFRECRELERAINSASEKDSPGRDPSPLRTTPLETTPKREVQLTLPVR